MLTAIVTIQLKLGDRERLSYLSSRGVYILETEQAEYEVRDNDYDTVEAFRNEESDRLEIQVYVSCEPSDLSYQLSTEAGHDFDNNLTLDAIKIDNVEISVGDEFIENGEIEIHENDDLIAGIINYLNEKVA